MPSRTKSTKIAVDAPFELSLALRGHGWIWLAPHRFDEERCVWTTPLRLHDKVALAEVTQKKKDALALRMRCDRPLAARDVEAARVAITRMLRLEEDLRPFWALCANTKELAWVAKRGAGRLLRSANLFEDFLKILFTTNCTWAATTSMTQKLVDAIGAPGPDGLRAFPTAEECEREPSFFRDVVRAGYRADACVELAQGFARGELGDGRFLDPTVDTATMRKRVLALRGFGPYAAGQALRLCGRYDDLALDSWCRAEAASKLTRSRAPTDAWFHRRYEPFGTFAGLAMWCELTADWH